MPAAEHGEKLLEMQLLRRAGDVNDFVGRAAPCSAFQPELQRGQVGRGVIEAAVAFAHQRRVVFEFGIIVEKDGHRAFARLGDAALRQFIDDVFEARIVITFAERVIELDAEPRIDALELRFGKRDHFPPDAGVFLVAGLAV